MTISERISTAHRNRQNIILPFSKGAPPDFDLEQLRQFVPPTAIPKIQEAMRTGRDITLPFGSRPIDPPRPDEITMPTIDPQKERVKRLIQELAGAIPPEQQEQYLAELGRPLGVDLRRPPVVQEGLVGEAKMPELEWTEPRPAEARRLEEPILRAPVPGEVFRELTPEEDRQLDIKKEARHLREDATPEKRIEAFTQQLIRRSPVGRIARIIDGDKFLPEDEALTTAFPYFSTAGAIGGELTSLFTVGKLLGAVGLPSMVGKAIPTKITNRIAREMIGRSVMTGSTLGMNTFTEEVAKARETGQISPTESVRNVVESTLFGSVLGPLGAIPNRIISAAATGTFAGSVTFAKTGDPEEAVKSGLLMSLFSAITHKASNNFYRNKAYQDTKTQLSEYIKWKRPDISPKKADDLAGRTLNIFLSRTTGAFKVVKPGEYRQNPDGTFTKIREPEFDFSDKINYKFFDNFTKNIQDVMKRAVAETPPDAVVKAVAPAPEVVVPVKPAPIVEAEKVGKVVGIDAETKLPIIDTKAKAEPLEVPARPPERAVLEAIIPKKAIIPPEPVKPPEKVVDAPPEVEPTPQELEPLKTWLQEEVKAGRIKSVDRFVNKLHSKFFAKQDTMTPQERKLADVFYKIKDKEAFYNQVVGEIKPAVVEKPPEVKPIPKELEPLAVEARKFKSAKEFVEAQFSKKPEYGMGHRPSFDGAPPAYNLLEGEWLPRDVYERPDFSISAGAIRRGDKAANESWAALQKIRGNPDAEITIYRASAKNELNIGDWVTFSKEYAKQSVEGTEKVHSFKVKARDILFAGDDINEFGYYPKSQLIDFYNQVVRGIKPIERVPEVAPGVVRPITRAIPKELEPLAAEARKFKNVYDFIYRSGIVPEWGTKNQFYLKNPYRKELDIMKKTKKYDMEILKKSERWEMEQVLKDKPSFLSDNLSNKEVSEFAKKHRLPYKIVGDDVVIAKNEHSLNKTLMAMDSKDRRELGLALGYQDLGIRPQRLTKTQLTDFYNQAIKEVKPEVKPKEVEPDVPAILPTPAVETKITPLVADIKKAPEVKKMIERGEKIVIIPDKDKLLAEIDTKIAAAPLRQDVVGEVVETVDFKNDGRFKIFNTKEALTEFRGGVKRTPETIVLGKDKVYSPTFTKSKAFIPQNKNYLTDKKGEGWSDQYVIDFYGDAPPAVKKNEKIVADFNVIKEQVKRNNVKPTNYIITNRDVDVRLGEKDSMMVVFKRPDGDIEVINKVYFDYFVNNYKNPKFVLSEKKNAKIRVDDGEITKGAVLPILITSKRRKEYLKLFEAPPEVKPEIKLEAPEEVSLARQIHNIIRNAKTSLEAQRELETKLDLKLSLPEIKNMETAIKGGVPFDVAPVLMKNLLNEIKTKDPKIVDDLGLGKMFDISMEDIQDSMTLLGKTKEWTLTKYRQIKEAIHQFEFASNYSYAYPDTRPYQESIVDSFVKELKMLTIISNSVRAIKLAEHPEILRQIWLEADRTDVDADKLIKESPELVETDLIAHEGLKELRNIIQKQIISEYMDGLFGVRIKSDGIRHQVEYTLKTGEKRTRWVNKERLDKMKIQYPGGKLEILDTKEVITLKMRDPKTGEYSQETMYVKKYDEALKSKLLTARQQELADKLIPYKDWIAHLRKGDYWIIVNEITAAGEPVEVFASRVPNRYMAEKMKEAIEQKSKMFTVDTHKHTETFAEEKLFLGSVVNIPAKLKNLGIDPLSEAGQRIINSQRSMSNLFSHLIRSKNLPGFETSYDSIVEGMSRISRSAVHRQNRTEMQDLLGEAIKNKRNFKDPFRYKVLVQYLTSMSEARDPSPFLDGAKSITYISVLGNSLRAAIQNISEPIWYWARIPKLNNPIRFNLPLQKEYTELIEQARQEGFIKPYLEPDVEASRLQKIEVLFSNSERFGTAVSFNLALRLARDKGLHGQEAYRFAYQQVLNVAKPFYDRGNVPIGLLQGKFRGVGEYGLLFLRWFTDWMGKTIRGVGGGRIRTLLKTGLAWTILAGLGTIPIFGRRLVRALRLGGFEKRPQDLDLTERFMLGGLIGVAGVDPRFLVPIWFKGVGETVAMGLDVMRGLEILSKRMARAERDAKRYGTAGYFGAFPMIGQYVSGALKAKYGVKSRGRIIYTPETFYERMLLRVGLTPFALGEIHRRRGEKAPPPLAEGIERREIERRGVEERRVERR